MKRKDIVASLMIEGFSEKTLLTMSDKELSILAKRVLSEQVPPVTNVSRTDIATQNALKQQKKPFATYEGEMKEENKDGNGKEYLIKKIKYKIEHETDETKKENLKELLRRMGYVGDGYDSSREKEMEDELIFMNNQYPPQPEDDMMDLNEWVDQVVSKNVHPFTSKNEIMSLIKSKLHEQEVDVEEPEVDVEALPDWLTYDAIMASGAPAPAEPKTRPTTKPGKRERDDPYKPAPGPNTRPKANSPAPAEPKTRPTTKPGKRERDDPYKPAPGPNTRPKAEKK